MFSMSIMCHWKVKGGRGMVEACRLGMGGGMSMRIGSLGGGRCVLGYVVICSTSFFQLSGYAECLSYVTIRRAELDFLVVVIHVQM